MRGLVREQAGTFEVELKRAHAGIHRRRSRKRGQRGILSHSFLRFRYLLKELRSLAIRLGGGAGGGFREVWATLERMRGGWEGRR